MSCPISTDVAEAASILKSGGLVAFPTETVYGLGANALDPKALARIFEVKNRPRFDPLIVHFADRAWLTRLVTRIPTDAQTLLERFWPGPLTLVLPKSNQVPDLVTSGLSTVAIRMPDHAIALQLLANVDLPIAAPSANPFGQLSPTCAEHVADQLGERIDLILDGGSCRVGIESTVLEFSNGGPLLLRPGGVPVEQIESVIGPITSRTEHSIASSPASPGMLPKHYAPRTPLMIAADLASVERDEPREQRVGLLAFEPPKDDTSRFAAVEVLSHTGNLTEATANFFAALRRLDALEYDLIVAQRFPERGLGRALNDRLLRAAHK